MDINPNPVVQYADDARARLIQRLRVVLKQGGLTAEQEQLLTVVDELGVEVLDCAAALWHLLQQSANKTEPSQRKPANTGIMSAIKMVRYRLDIGSRHQLNVETLKRVLVEESGVDKNNISNINIQGLYTLIELPDAMPPDIFQHLKLVEINDRKLDIKRVKSRNKKRVKVRVHGSKLASSTNKALQATAEQVNGNAI